MRSGTARDRHREVNSEAPTRRGANDREVYFST